MSETETEQIKPVLTPEWWAETLEHLSHGFGEHPSERDAEVRFLVAYAIVRWLEPMRLVTPADLLATAALALYGQPFGFRRDDVVWLRDAANEIRIGRYAMRGFYEEPTPMEKLLHSIADRIAALLPPEQP